MSRKNFALTIAQQLSAWGVRTVFGVAGDDIIPLLDALANEGQIRYIGAAHEAGAAFMASNWAKLTGELGVCIASAAGTVNLLQGLADAYMDGAPVLAITGQVETARIGTKADQYYNQQRLFSNFAGYSELVTNAQAGIRLFFEAASQALFRRTVAHLTVPSDLWSEQVEAEPAVLPALVREGSRPGVKGDIRGDLDRAAETMQASRRPLLIIGNLGRGLLPQIQRLVTTWRPAVVIAQEAKGTVPDTWPEVVGGIGQAWTPRIVSEADCVVIVGAAPYEERYLPKVAVIQIQTQPAQVKDTYLWDSLAGDVGYILSSLSDRLDGHQLDPTWLDRISAAKQELHALIQGDLAISEKPIHPARLMASLNRALSEDAIVAIDQGAFAHWFDRDFVATSQRILLSNRWRSMGSALPAAIAAQARFRQRQVLALVGDGGMLMSLGELVTARKYDLPITVVVANNYLYGLEKDKALAFGLNPLGLDLSSPDFSKIAEACGVRGIRVEAPEQLEGALEEALALREPMVVDVVCADVRLPEMVEAVPELAMV